MTPASAEQRRPRTAYPILLLIMSDPSERQGEVFWESNINDSTVEPLN